MATGYPAAAPDCSPAEAFLLAQPEVLDVYCATLRERLIATVHVAKMSQITPGKLLEACRRELGAKAAPSLIVFVQTDVDSDEAVA